MTKVRQLLQQQKDGRTQLLTVCFTDAEYSPKLSPIPRPEYEMRDMASTCQRSSCHADLSARPPELLGPVAMLDMQVRAQHQKGRLGRPKRVNGVAPQRSTGRPWDG